MQDCPSERQGSWLKAGQADWDRLIIQRQITRLPCQQVRNSSGRPMSNWQQVVGYYSFLYTAWETTPGIMEAWPNSKMSHTAQLWSQYQAKAIRRLDSLNQNRGVGVWYLWLCGGSVLQIVYFQPIISTACCSKVAKILPVQLDLQIELAKPSPNAGLRLFKFCGTACGPARQEQYHCSPAGPARSSAATYSSLSLPSSISTTAEISILISYSCV